MTTHPDGGNFDFLNDVDSTTDGRPDHPFSDAASMEPDPPFNPAADDRVIEAPNSDVPDPDSAAGLGNVTGLRVDSAASVLQRSGTVPRQWLMVAVSYSSALTLFVVGGLATGYLTLGSQSSRLESLPDVRPLAANEVRTVSQHSTLPGGHVLRLGDTRRFGDVSVTPLRITLEPVNFRYYRMGDAFVRDPTRPVIKLWLEFRNESTTVAFPPWDVALMTYRHRRDKPADAAPASSLLFDPADPDKYVLNLDHPSSGEWLLEQQASAVVLAPGETLETFVASAEGGHEDLVENADELVWRIQFRKGVHPENRTGITTLVDVRFSPDEILVSDSDETAPDEEAIGIGGMREL